MSREAHHRSAKETFCYFAYGSNLLGQRLRIRNPSAELVGVGELSGWELGFGGKEASRTWHGFPATIRLSPDTRVLGAVWRISNAESGSLDAQEGVEMAEGGYERLNVLVRMLGPRPADEPPVCECRSYKLKRDSYEGRLPSPAYKSVIVAGAKEVGLPGDYIDKLKSIETNGYSGPIGVELKGVTGADCDGHADH